MTDSIKEITPEEALALSGQGCLLVDVREADEVAEKRYDVPQYLSLPLSQLVIRYTEIPPEQEVIIACRSGVRSQKAIDFLAQQGYNRLLNLQGGILSWEEKGLPIKEK